MLDWSKYITVADWFQHKAKAQDRGDLSPNIIVSLADAQIRLDNNDGGQLSDVAWLDRSIWELGFPDRLAQIARKIASGHTLTNKEHQYLWRFRQKEQKRLF